MFEIKQFSGGFAVYLNGLYLRGFATEALATAFIAHVSGGTYTSQTTTTGAH